MNCISGNDAYYLCINKYCEDNNSFVCSNPLDSCKQMHQACSLVSLSYIKKKIVSHSSSQKYESLIPLYDKAKSIATQISNILTSTTMSIDIEKMLSSGKALTLDDKEKICKFIGQKKYENQAPDLYGRIEKELEEFQILITQFQSAMKQKRNREIKELKKRLHQEQKGKNIFDGEREHIREHNNNKKLEKVESLMKVSNMKSKRRQEQKEIQLPILEQKKQFMTPQAVKSRVDNPSSKQPQKSKMSSFQRMPSALKSHVAKGPLFSKITNDIRTINSFFSNKFSSSELLYRASENGFSVSKFHEKCNGHKNTLTLVYTEFDKIIGGYTPLPWITGTGEWYEDEEGKSFLFNLTSGEKYPLISKDKAIWCSRTYGPSFGHPDLQISDKALYNSNSCANFPSCYNNGNYKNSAGSTQMFCGSKNGHFRIREWQVFQLTFS